MTAPASLPGVRSNLQDPRSVFGMDGGGPAGKVGVGAIAQRPGAVMVEEDEAAAVIQFPENDAAAGDVLRVVFHIEAEMNRIVAAETGAFPGRQPSVIASCVEGGRDCRKK